MTHSLGVTPIWGGYTPHPGYPKVGNCPTKSPPPHTVRGGSIGDYSPGGLKNTSGPLFTVVPRTVGAKQKGYDWSPHMDADTL